MAAKKLVQGGDQENDPRQIFVDWVNNIRGYALNADGNMKRARDSKIRSQRMNYMDTVSDYIGKIIGACDAITTVIKQ